MQIKLTVVLLYSRSLLLVAHNIISIYSETVLDRRKKDHLQLTLSYCGLTVHYYYSFF